MLTLNFCANNKGLKCRLLRLRQTPKVEYIFLELLGMEKHVESPSIIRLILCLKEVPHFHSWFLVVTGRRHDLSD